MIFRTGRRGGFFRYGAGGLLFCLKCFLLRFADGLCLWQNFFRIQAGKKNLRPVRDASAVCVKAELRGFFVGAQAGV